MYVWTGIHPTHKNKAWLKKFVNILEKLEKYFHSTPPHPTPPHPTPI